jgi:tetratricopeptide (TPR) repeat protein
LLGQGGAAGEERQQADAAGPRTAFDFFEDALDHYRRERVEEAAAACEEALQRQSDSFWAQYLKALCNLRLKRWGEAKVGLTVCLARRRDYPWPLLLRGTAHGGLKEYGAAEADFAQALEASPDPTFRAAVLTNRSAVRLARGKWEDAERDLRQAIDLQPNAYQGHVNLARARQERGDRDGAVRLLDRALALRPDAGSLYYSRARLQAERGDREAARRDFEEFLAREAASSRSDRAASARVELAHLYHLAGDDSAALAACRAVLADRPDFAPAYRQLAETLLARQQYGEAGRALDRYLAAGGERSPAVYRARGLIYAGEGEQRAAVEAYTQALLLTRAAPTLSDRGWAYLKLESPRPALLDFDEALLRDPAHTDALAGRGLALALQGRAAEAAASVDAALEHGPRTLPLLLTCARIYARAAAAERALVALDTALGLVPDAERPGFWRNIVERDPAFLSLRRTRGWLDLARKYAR